MFVHVISDRCTKVYSLWIRPRPHKSVFKRKRSCFAPFSKRFASTLIVFASFSPVHTTTPYLFWKRFYTLSAHAKMNSTHAHFNILAREIAAKLKRHGSVCPPFWILTVEWSGARSCLFWWRHRFQIASFSPSTLENSVFKKHRFQIAPLWRAFSNGSVFSDRFRRCSVDDSRIRSKTAPFSFENGLVWTGPHSDLTVDFPTCQVCFNKLQVAGARYPWLTKELYDANEKNLLVPWARTYKERTIWLKCSCWFFVIKRPPFSNFSSFIPSFLSYEVHLFQQKGEKTRLRLVNRN